MKFLLVVICMFIMAGLSLSEEVQPEKNKYEIYEVNLVTDIVKDVDDFIKRSKFYYGHKKNSHIIQGIALTLLVKYNIISGDYIAVVVGDPVTLRPVKVLFGLDMVFSDYVFEFDELNIVEEENEKIRNKDI